MTRNQVCSRTELALAGDPSSSQEANLKSMGHFFFLIPNEVSKHRLENHKLFPHGEVVRSKWIFLISEKIYNFLTNSKPQTPSLAEGNSGALTLQLTLERAQLRDVITKGEVRDGRRSQTKELMHFYTDAH